MKSSSNIQKMASLKKSDNRFYKAGSDSNEQRHGASDDQTPRADKDLSQSLIKSEEIDQIVNEKQTLNKNSVSKKITLKTGENPLKYRPDFSQHELAVLKNQFRVTTDNRTHVYNTVNPT